MLMFLGSSQSFLQANTPIQRSLCSCLCSIIRAIKSVCIDIERSEYFTIWNYTGLYWYFYKYCHQNLIVDNFIHTANTGKKYTVAAFSSSVCVDRSFSLVPVHLQVHESRAMIFVNGGAHCRICFPLVPIYKCSHLPGCSLQRWDWIQTPNAVYQDRWGREPFCDPVEELGHGSNWRMDTEG